MDNGQIKDLSEDAGFFMKRNDDQNINNKHTNSLKDEKHS